MNTTNPSEAEMMLEAVKYQWVETHSISFTLLIALTSVLEKMKIARGIDPTQ